MLIVNVIAFNSIFKFEIAISFAFFPHFGLVSFMGFLILHEIYCKFEICNCLMCIVNFLANLLKRLIVEKNFIKIFLKF